MIHHLRCPRGLDAIRRIVQLLGLRPRGGEAHGLSAAQLFVLQQLSAAGGALTPAESPRARSRTQSSVSVVVRRLVDAGLVSAPGRPPIARRVERRLPVRRTAGGGCPGSPGAADSPPSNLLPPRNAGG